MKASALPKVILDIGLLGCAHDCRTWARGVHRVTHNLLQGLIESRQCELRFVATQDLAGAYDFLGTRGFLPDQVLKFRPGQLRRSRQGRHAAQWVHRHINDPQLVTRATRWSLARFADFAFAGEKRILPGFLTGADIYHSPLAPIPAAVQAHPKIKHFLTIHDLIPLTNPQCLGGDAGPYIRRLLGSLTPKSFVFCVSESVKSDLLSLTSVRPEQVTVTPLAADISIFHPVADAARVAAVCSSYGIPHAPYFLTLSSFDPRKNFGHIIHCFSRLVESGEVDACNLVIVGSNPERNRFVDEAIAHYPKIKQRILLPGYIPDHDLAAIYSGAFAFLFPSHGEGFGIPPLEAMQCGTPVISSNAPALPEVLGDAAVLIDPQDADAWCQAMITLSRNAALRMELHQRGMIRAAQFTWQRFTEATLKGYQLALTA